MSKIPRQWNSTLPQRKTPMKRSGFKARTFPAKPSPSLSSSSKGKPVKRRSALGPGKKTKEWDALRARIKPLFERAGITTCELRLPGCWGSQCLGFSHPTKRRFITTGKQLEEVILICSPNCHEKIEVMPHSEMARIVREVIARRAVVIPSLFD